MTEQTEDVLITRVFDSPRAQVFRAWTDPDEIAGWYGPEHFDAPRDKIRVDLRVGGRWELTMVQTDGTEFPIGYDILELVEPELLVLRSDPMPLETALAAAESDIARIQQATGWDDYWKWYFRLTGMPRERPA